MRSSILHQLHEAPAGGHLGEDKTLHKLRERFYWPGHQKDVKICCRTCKDCAARKTPVPKRKAPLTPIKVGYPLQMIGIDFLGQSVETDAGNNYVLVVGDHFTKYMSAFAVANQEAETVANVLMEEYFCDKGFPEQLHSDQGAQFESQLIAEMCKAMEIRKTIKTAYHPACNGEIERFNKTLADMLATALEGHRFDWDKQLKMACFAFNTSVHATTGYTSLNLMHGYEARLPVDVVYGSAPQKSTSYHDYVRCGGNSSDGSSRTVRTSVAIFDITRFYISPNNTNVHHTKRDILSPRMRTLPQYIQYIVTQPPFFESIRPRMYSVADIASISIWLLSVPCWVPS